MDNFSSLKVAEDLNKKILSIVQESVKKLFPIENENRRLELVNIESIDMPSVTDFQRYYTTKLNRGTWSLRVRVKLRLVDKTNNKVIDEATTTLFNLPIMDPNDAFLFQGNEYNLPTQLRLKAGVYYTAKSNDTYESKFFLEKGENFKIAFDPRKYTLRVIIGGRSVKLLPLLRALKLSEDDLKRIWGADTYELVKQNDDGDPEKELQSFITGSYRDYQKANWPIPIEQDPAQATIEYLKNTRVDKDVMKITMDKEIDRLNPELIAEAAKKLFDLVAGNIEEQQSTSLIFKKAHAPEDFIRDLLEEQIRLAKVTLAQRLPRFDQIDRIIPTGYLQRPISNFFANSSVVQLQMHANPISTILALKKATYTGEGGIEDQRAITNEQRAVDPYHFGFIDPVHTPESDQVGVTLYLSNYANVANGELWQTFYDVKNRRMKKLRPIDLYDKYVSFPGEGEINKQGEAEWKNPTAVKALYKGKMIQTNAENIDYILPNKSQMFSAATTLLPFLHSLQPTRGMMASKHLQQVVGIKNREIPLVQSQIEPGNTEEEVNGDYLKLMSPVTGTVTDITDFEIKIKDDTGKTHTVTYFRNLPSFQGQTTGFDLKVNKGDHVQKGQLIADSIYTKDGVLATGVNLRVAYLPWKGLNYEDGIVITESAAKKLASTHNYLVEMNLDNSVSTSKNRFTALFPTVYTKEQLDKLDDDGVVKVGTELDMDDPVILAVRFVKQDKWRDLSPSFMKLSDYRNETQEWFKEVKGKVIDVKKLPDSIRVVVQTEEPTMVGDKLAGRHGNKGTVGAVIPDSEAPRTEDGKPIGVIMNPAGVPSRLNPSQLLESLAGKIAEKKGLKKYVVEQFNVDKFNAKNLLEEAKAAGVKEKERLFIPGEGWTETPVFTGIQYVNKLEQQVEKKTNLREEWGYDQDEQPLRGSGEHGGARAIDPLTLYALLAHNVRDVLSEMATYKANKNDDFWLAIELGRVPPAPKNTFAFRRFEAHLNAAGIGIDKKPNEWIIRPLKDSEIKKFAPISISDPKFIKAHNLEPEEGGLFDPKIFGGINGEQWARVDLVTPVFNPTFESVVRPLLGLKTQEMKDLVNGKLGVNERNEIVPEKDAKYFGGEAFERLLNAIDVDKKINELKQKLLKSGNDPDVVATDIKTLRVLQAIKNRSIDPKDFVLKSIPIMPPRMRPVYPSESGDFLVISPVNYRYRDLMLFNKELDSLKQTNAISDDELKKKWSGKLYSYVEGLITRGTDDKQEGKGILPFLAGEGSPKGGYIHSKLLRKRQELSSTLVIQNGPELGLDQVGLPEEAAWNLYKPFIIQRLTMTGFDLKTAKDMVKNRDERAKKILLEETQRRPILINRSPSLHMYSIMAFKPVLVQDKAMKLNPLIVEGFNADFDGDTMGVFVPVTEEARKESFKMLPSNSPVKPFSENRLMYKLRQEYVGAIFNITKLPKELSRPDRSFSDYPSLYEAWEKRQLKHDDVVFFQGIVSTVGQHLINGLLPKPLRDYSGPWDNKKLRNAFQKFAGMDRENAIKMLDTWKDIARTAMIRVPFTVSVSDTFDPDLQKFRTELEEIDKIPDENEKKEKIMQLTKEVDNAVKEEAAKKYDENGFYNMLYSGTKGSIDQVRQMVFAPIAVTDHKGNLITATIKHSYGEGLTPSEYFASTFGARRGILEKKMGVSEPGAITKELINNLADLVVVEDDDPDDQGIPYNPKVTPVVDRVLAQDVVVNGRTIGSKGELVTPKMQADFEQSNVDLVYVKSPITSTIRDGLSATSVGASIEGKLPSRGRNVGILAGQALTEPLSQSTFNKFHTGGVASSRSFDLLEVVDTLLHAKEGTRNTAVLAQKTGRVEKIEKGALNTRVVTIEGVKHTVPAIAELKVKVGDYVRKGQPITDGIVSPMEVYRLRGPADAERTFAEQLKTFAEKGGIDINTAGTETLARGIFSTVAILDNNNDQNLPIGSYVPVSFVEKLNKQKSGIKELPVDQAIGKKLAENVRDILNTTVIDEDIAKELKAYGVTKVKVYDDVIKTVPVVRGTLMQPLYKEDWMHKMTYTRIKQTIPWAAASGEKSPADTSSALSAWMKEVGIKHKPSGKY
mgnify:FL=1